MVCMPASWCAWNWLCGYLACLTLSSFSEHLCMLALFDDQVAQVRVTSEEITFYVDDLAVSAELDLLIHYRDVLGNLVHEDYDTVQIDADTNYPGERAKDKLMKICDVFRENRPLEHWASKTSAEKSKDNNNIPLHENGKHFFHMCFLTSSRVIHPKGKWGFSRGSFQEHPKWDSYITLNGHRASEAAILYEHGAYIKELMPKLLHSEYYAEPGIQELAAKERDEPGFFRRVKHFVYRCRDLRSQMRVC
ncbi:hypothetical protein MKX03_007914 [Papaver bracteatum]|nr:hypothetical protein MKX03_007914 [Papaver bracteatum]